VVLMVDCELYLIDFQCIYRVYDTCSVSLLMHCYIHNILVENLMYEPQKTYLHRHSAYQHEIGREGAVIDLVTWFTPSFIQIIPLWHCRPPFLTDTMGNAAYRRTDVACITC
jgi:hypothetical protein